MMQDARPDRASRLIAKGNEIRVGRKVGRTLYVQVTDDPSDYDLLIGMADSAAIAEWIARCCNTSDRGVDKFLP